MATPEVEIYPGFLLHDRTKVCRSIDRELHAAALLQVLDSWEQKVASKIVAHQSFGSSLKISAKERQAIGMYSRIPRFAVTSLPLYFLSMQGACKDDRERGLILLLLNTGMHPSVFSSPRKRNGKPRERPKIIKEGSTRFLEWKRPKTNKTLRSLPIRKDEITLTKSFLKRPTQSNKHHDTMLERIGRLAGYDGVSCFTLRHTYCIWLLRSKEEGGAGFTIYQVLHLMGCTLEVAARNYSIMSGAQLIEETKNNYPLSPPND